MKEAQAADAARVVARLRWSEGPGLLMGVLLPVSLAFLSFWIATLGSGSERYPPLAPIIFHLSIGLSQMVYIVPLLLWGRRRGWRGFVRGLWTGAGLVLATNIALWADALLHDR